jgi:hypothetical protein
MIRDGQCRLVLPPRPRLILSGTLYQKAHNFDTKLCDYIVFWLDSRGESVAVIELKSGHVPLSAIEQLGNGAGLAEELCSSMVSSFAALLATRKSLHPLDRKVLARKKIMFKGRGYPVTTVRCGSRFVTVPPQAAG